MLELTVRLVASLAIVVGLLLLLARFGAHRLEGRSGDLVRVVHRQPLSRTSGVAVVTVGARVLVLGTTEQQVTVLAELDPEDLEPVSEALVLGDAGAHRAHVPARTDGALTGSVLSPGTWRQALAAATGKAS